MQDGDLIETLNGSYLDLADRAVDFVPKLLVALLLILIGMILARVVSKFVGKAVDYLETSKPVVSTLKGLGVKTLDIDGIVAVFTRWAILLVFLSAAVDVLGLSVLTETFDALVDFVPNILAAAVIAGLSFIAGSVVHDVVLESAKKAGITAHRFLASASKVAVLVFGLPLAAAQLGLDLSILTNNLTVIVAGVMLAFGLAFGLGGKDVARKILNDAYDTWKQ